MTSGSARFRINWMELFGDPSSADRVVDVRFESPSLAPQAGARPAALKGRRAVEIDWGQIFGYPSSPDRGVDVRFESPSSAPQAGARAAAAAAAAALKGPRARGVARALSDEDKRCSSPGRMLAGLRGGAGAVADRRVTRAAAKAASQGPGAPSAAKNVVELSDQEDECVDVDEHVVRRHNCGQLPVNKRNSEGKSPSDDDDREQSARPAAKHKSEGKSPSDDDDREQSARPAAKRKSEGKSPSDDDNREQSARPAAKNDNKEAAAPPEEIFEALRAISGLDRDGLLRAYSKLIRDDRQFRSLMALPKDMRKDWLLMEIGNQ